MSLDTESLGLGSCALSHEQLGFFGALTAKPPSRLVSVRARAPGHGVCSRYANIVKLVPSNTISSEFTMPRLSHFDGCLGKL